MACEPAPSSVCFAIARPYIAKFQRCCHRPSWLEEVPLKTAITPLRVLHEYRRTATSIIYGSIAAGSYSVAFLLRFEFAWPATYTGLFLWSLALIIAIRVSFALATRLGVGSWRYVGIRDLLRLTLAATAGSIVFFAITWGLPLTPRVPRSVIVMEWLLTGNLTAALWVAYRLFFEKQSHRAHRSKEAKRVLVVWHCFAFDSLLQVRMRHYASSVSTGTA